LNQLRISALIEDQKPGVNAMGDKAVGALFARQGDVDGVRVTAEIVASFKSSDVSRTGQSMRRCQA